MMGLLDLYKCTNIECSWRGVGKKGESCIECGTVFEKVSSKRVREINQAKKKINKAEKKKGKAKQAENKRLNKLLFHDALPDDELIRSIESDMNNLEGHEAGTSWMRLGTLLSFNSTQQMIGAGFKAIIDQNKVLIKQNELLYRQNKLLNANLEKLNNQFEDI